jgi:SAM-dependent methyltransferase
MWMEELMTQVQDAVFGESEGNAWFRRNAETIANSRRPDALLDMVRLLSPDRRASFRSICDVGCSSGDRLARFAAEMPELSHLCGFDASQEAVDVGQDLNPTLVLRQGLADVPPFKESFDLVLVSFVLHWVDRTKIAQAVAAIDGLVKAGGTLLVSDFLPDRPCARHYHHREDIDIFTYKQDYSQIFLSLGYYVEIARHVFAHDRPTMYLEPSDDQNRAMCSMMVKVDRHIRLP